MRQFTTSTTRTRRSSFALASILLTSSLAQGAHSQASTQAAQDSGKGAQDTTKKTHRIFASGDTARTDTIPTSQWGEWDPGEGFLLAKTPLGTFSISGYVLFRYLNQSPASQTFRTYLGPQESVDTRNDIQLQRIMMFFKGWLFRPRLRYTVMLWSVNSTAQVAIAGNLNYTFNQYLTLYGGYGALVGSRSMVGVFPYFLATDRVLTDEFFRPGFTGAVWANGRLAPGLFYAATLGNNLSQLGVNAAKLNRYLAKAASIFWEPTTGEFGDRGGFGDYDAHTHSVATRFGASYTWSREDRRNDTTLTNPDNTQLRISTSQLLFQTGVFAPGLTLQWSDFNLYAFDGAVKYDGWFFYAQGYYRILDRFIATGPMPFAHILDSGFDFQTAYMIVPKTVMLYGWTSQLYGQFNRSWDLAGGVNWYPYHERNFRLNGLLIYVDRSAWSSLFGYYIGGQTGPTVSLSADIFF